MMSHNIKKVMAVIFAICLIWAAMPGTVEAAGPTVNLRNVFEMMGSVVTWDASTNSILVTREGVNLQFKLYSNRAVKNGVPITMDQPITVDSRGNSLISVYAVYWLAKNYAREEGVYQVQSGDSLWKIATARGVTVAQLKQWNRLTSDIIYPGQVLHTKDPYYTVKAGDTLYGIASRNQITIEQIKEANGLAGDMIYIGQRLYIPPRPSVSRPPMLTEAVFPLMDRTYDAYSNTYGDDRSYSITGEASRIHEGIDIMAKTWTPVFAAEDGVVIRKGWSTLGGWRLTVQTANGIAYYYAHMAGYAEGVNLGSRVSKGQLVGFVGSTGYGPEGTSGNFVPHLHVGLYDTNMDPWKPINPYPYLRWWEYR